MWFNKNMKKKFKNGFTLAEVLITLIVVGIIAALTIPAIIPSIQKRDLESRFAKVNSVLKQTVARAEATEGNFTNWEWISSDKIFFEYFTPYLSVTKICKPNELGCGEDTEYKYLRGEVVQTKAFQPSVTRFITSDGAKWLIGVNSGCVAKGEYCAMVRVDVNGDAPPNMYGRDLFTFFMLPYTNEVRPEGAYEFPLPYNAEKGWIAYEKHEIDDDCNVESGGGTLCGARIIADGFKMKY